jgi:hypothetical protein
MQINQEFLQQYFNKFRKGYYAIESQGFKQGYSNRFGNPTINPNSWEGLLDNFLDLHDLQEINWIESQGLSCYYPYNKLEQGVKL